MSRPKGYKCSPELRARMSAAIRKALADLAVRARMSAARKTSKGVGQRGNAVSARRAHRAAGSQASMKK